MVFRDTTNLYDSATHHADFLLGLTPGETTQYTLQERARSANYWKYQAAVWIWKVQDSWQFDDSEYANYPIATTTLVNSRNDYVLPTNALAIERVEVLGVNSIWHKLKPIDEKQIRLAELEFEKVDARPIWYRIIGRSLWLYPAPDNGVSVTLTAGLRIQWQREISEFTNSTTTTEIGFGEPWDRVVAIGMAYDFAMARGMEVVSRLTAMIWGGIVGGTKVVGIKELIEGHFSSRLEDRPTRIVPRSTVNNRFHYT